MRLAEPELMNDPAFARCYQRWVADPSSAAFVGVADILRAQGHFFDALRVCQEGLRYNPELLTARIILVRVLEGMGKTTDAYAMANDILKDVPNHAEARSIVNKLRPFPLNSENEVVTISKPEAVVTADVAVIMPELDNFTEEEITESEPLELMLVDEVSESKLEIEPEIEAVTVYEADSEIDSEEEYESAPTTEDVIESESETPVFPGLATLTMAKLYAMQGHKKLATAVYRAIIASDPSNAEARAELEKIAG